MYGVFFLRIFWDRRHGNDVEEGKRDILYSACALCNNSGLAEGRSGLGFLRVFSIG